MGEESSLDLGENFRPMIEAGTVLFLNKLLNVCSTYRKLFHWLNMTYFTVFMCDVCKFTNY